MDSRIETMNQRLKAIVERDVAELVKKEVEYGRSWCRRGGVGAFFVMSRKWDRLEEQVKKKPEAYDIFKHIEYDNRPEGILDDLRDLRAYLLLIEEEMMHNGIVPDLLKPEDEPEGVPKKVSKLDRPHLKRPDGMEHPFGYDSDQDK